MNEYTFYAHLFIKKCVFNLNFTWGIIKQYTNTWGLKIIYLAARLYVGQPIYILASNLFFIITI